MIESNFVLEICFMTTVNLYSLNMLINKQVLTKIV